MILDGGEKLAYKIAIGSSDGIHVDLKFGEVEKFLIFEVAKQIKLQEERVVQKSDELESCVSKTDCNNKSCQGNGRGCNGSEDVISKVSLIADCRCVVCKKIGFQAQKQLEKKAISVFDVECDIEEALEKITFYYKKIDNNEALRRE